MLSLASHSVRHLRSGLPETNNTCYLPLLERPVLPKPGWLSFPGVLHSCLPGTFLPESWVFSFSGSLMRFPSSWSIVSFWWNIFFTRFWKQGTWKVSLKPISMCVNVFILSAWLIIWVWNSGLDIIFCQHFEDTDPLLFCFQHCWKKCPVLWSLICDLCFPLGSF